MNYIETEKQRICESLADTGFAQSHIYHLLGDKELRWFEKCQEFYADFASDPQIVTWADSLERGLIERTPGKVFEKIHCDYLKGPLTLETGAFLHLYSNDVFLDIAEYYLDVQPVIRNVLTWIHAYDPAGQAKIWQLTGISPRDRSQWWHRDTEDSRILKIWMYYSSVTRQTGALEYVKNSRYGDKNSGITPNYIAETDSMPPKAYVTLEDTRRIPPEDIVMANGDTGTIIFGDTNGIHRGGFLTSPGIRLKSQCCYLRPTAYQIRKGPLQTFDHNPTGGNLCDKNHPLYGTLSTRAQEAMK